MRQVHCCIAKSDLFMLIPALYLPARRQRISSSQRAFIDWQHSSSQLPIRIKEPDASSSRVGLFFIFRIP